MRHALVAVATAALGCSSPVPTPAPAPTSATPSTPVARPAPDRTVVVYSERATTRPSTQTKAFSFTRLRSDGVWTRTTYDFDDAFRTARDHGILAPADVTERFAALLATPTPRAPSKPADHGHVAFYGFFDADRFLTSAAGAASPDYARAAGIVTRGLRSQEPRDDGAWFIENDGQHSMGEGGSWSLRVDATGRFERINTGDIGDGTDDVRIARGVLDAPTRDAIVKSIRAIALGYKPVEKRDDPLHQDRWTLRGFTAQPIVVEDRENNIALSTAMQVAAVAPFKDDPLHPIIAIEYSSRIGAAGTLMMGTIGLDGAWKEKPHYDQKVGTRAGQLDPETAAVLFTAARLAGEARAANPGEVAPPGPPSPNGAPRGIYEVTLVGPPLPFNPVRLRLGDSAPQLAALAEQIVNATSP